MGKECPLRFIAYVISPTIAINKAKIGIGATQCKERLCEWYDYDNGCCNIQHLQDIAEIMRG